MLRLSLRTLLAPPRALSPYSIFLTPSRSLSPYSILIAQCSTSSPPHFTYPHSHSDPDPRNVRVAVWWDLDNCNLPSGLNVFRGAQAITAAIESSGIKGPIQIKAFGDMLRLARTDQEALSSTASTAIDFTPIPHDGNYNAHISLLDDLMYWALQNPPPAHLFLITVDESCPRTVDDGYCARLVNDLRNKSYNILLATKEPAPTILCLAATIIWDWDALVRGENLTGRYFRQPPVDSWYGHYEGPLENPYRESESLELPAIFSQDSFWEDIQDFFDTDVGSFIIAESSNSKHMSYYLRKYGPPAVKSLEGRHVAELVDILESKYIWRPQ